MVLVAVCLSSKKLAVEKTQCTSISCLLKQTKTLAVLWNIPFYLEKKLQIKSCNISLEAQKTKEIKYLKMRFLRSASKSYIFNEEMTKSLKDNVGTEEINGAKFLTFPFL